MQTSQAIIRLHGLDRSERRRTLAATVLTSLWTVFRRIAAIARHWRMARKARRDQNAFLAMSNHMLRDIGVARHDLLDLIAEEQKFGRSGS